MIKWGMLYGLASVAFTMILFLINKNLLFDWKIALLSSLGLAVLFMILALKETREANEGYLGYGEAVKVALVTFVIGSFIGTIWMFVLYNFIDPTLFELEKEMALKTAEQMASMFGADEDVLEQMMDETREQMEAMGDSKSIGSLLGPWGISILIPGLPIALIVGAIMKKSS